MMDLEQHLLRQMAFSRATFGPGARTAGVCDHIRKELVEVESAPLSFRSQEWVDVVILALDGLTRSLLNETNGVETQEQAAFAAVMAIRNKQSKNERRNWPDWRTAPLDKAIEHTREGGDA